MNENARFTSSGLVTHIYVTELCHHWFRWWLVACSAPSCYQNQWWFCQLEQIWILNKKQYNDFHSRNCIIEWRLRSGGHVVHVSICWINSAAWFSLLCLRRLICTGDKHKSNTYTKENGVRTWEANQWCAHHDDVIKWKHFPYYWSFVGDFTGEFPSQRPVTRSFDVFFDLRLKRLSNQSCGWCFQMALNSLWRHCNDDSVVLVFFVPRCEARW